MKVTQSIPKRSAKYPGYSLNQYSIGHKVAARGERQVMPEVEYQFFNGKVGGMSKTARVVRAAERREGIETRFMEMSAKLTRAENQREHRRAQR